MPSSMTLSTLLTIVALLPLPLEAAEDFYETDFHHYDNPSETGPDVDLFKAVEKGMLQAVAWHLSRNAKDYEIKHPKSESTLWHAAVLHGQTAILQYLAENSHGDLAPFDADGDTPLHIAMRLGDIESVRILMWAARSRSVFRAVIDAVNPKTLNTPLFDAIYSNVTYSDKSPLACAAELVEAKVDLEHLNSDELMPIHAAMVNSRLDFVKMFLHKQSDLADKPAGSKLHGKTISHIAAELNITGFLSEMADYFRPSAVDSLGQTPACYVARAGNVRFAAEMAKLGDSGLQSLTTSEPVCRYNVESHRWHKGSPLHIAAMYRFQLLVAFLVKHGADIGARASSKGTILHAMAMVTSSRASSDDYDIELKELLPDIDTEDVLLLKNYDEECCSVLRLKLNAQEDGDLVTWLILKNSDLLESKDQGLRTPYLVAVRHCAVGFANLLAVRFGANKTAVDYRGYSALHYAPNEQMFRLALSLTPSFTVDHLTPRLMTPLMVAVKDRKAIRLIWYLINTVNANVTARNDRGDSLGHLAVPARNFDFMEEFGSLLDFRARDNSGLTPLHHVVLNGDVVLLKTMTAILWKDKATWAALNERTPWDEFSCLHLAAANGYVDTADWISGYHPGFATVVDALGRTPAHLAVKNDETSLKVVDTIIHNFGKRHHARGQYSQLLSKRDRDGKTLLSLAVERDCDEIVEMLLVKYNASCISPLRRAQERKMAKLVRRMLDTGKCSSDQLNSPDEGLHQRLAGYRQRDEEF